SSLVLYETYDSFHRSVTQPNWVGGKDDVDAHRSVSRLRSPRPAGAGHYRPPGGDADGCLAGGRSVHRRVRPAGRGRGFPGSRRRAQCAHRARHATRSGSRPRDGLRRAAARGIQPAAVLGRDAGRRPDRGQLWRRGAAVDHPGRRESQTAPYQDRQRGKASDQRLTTDRRTAGPGAQHLGKGVSDVATSTAWATSLLDEAAAIVEAEWIRLQQDEALWEREVADLPADLPAPRPGPPRADATTTARRWPSQPMPGDRGRCPTRPWPATPVWATQRSPPSPRETCSKGTVGQGR